MQAEQAEQEGVINFVFGPTRTLPQGIVKGLITAFATGMTLQQFSGSALSLTKMMTLCTGMSFLFTGVALANQLEAPVVPVQRDDHHSFFKRVFSLRLPRTFNEGLGKGFIFGAATILASEVFSIMNSTPEKDQIAFTFQLAVAAGLAVVGQINEIRENPPVQRR